MRGNGFLQFAFFWLAMSSGFAATPTLSIQRLPTGQLRLTWPDSAVGFSLEHADALMGIAPWQSLPDSILSTGGSFSVTLPIANQTRFYRLRLDLPWVREVSPANGESGVAVTRETVFRLSSPLAPNSQITPNQLFAEYGGRRLLSRTELASDRRTITLFYLENLPASARVQVMLVGDGLRAASGLDVDADGDGQAGGTGLWHFDTASITALSNTAVTGRVFASELGMSGTNHPLAGVIVTVDGAEETLRTTTDANGAFRLQPAPAGRFFVHVDGRTAVESAWPGGAYYPFVGKAWDAVAGYTNNLAGGSGEIFLPLIQGDALQAVSATEDTRVTFAPSLLTANPSLAGVEIMVPANALFRENGTRGGKVGLAPVSPDRLPGPLPPGLNLPLVITVQTDGGSNFDVPVPAKFPNLPDPVTGLLLSPGAKTVLWSFNHDTGRWEAQGLGTISADGRYVVTDPGVGIRQPGWHGFANGSPGAGPSGGQGGGGCIGPNCECTQQIICVIPHEGRHYMLCAFDCLGNTWDRIFGEEKTPRSPVQDGLQCVGGPDKCPGRPDDVLTKKQRDCMDGCRYPDSEFVIYTVKCEGFISPCPTNSSRQGPEPRLSRNERQAALMPGFVPVTDRLEEQYYIWAVEEEYLAALTGTTKLVEMEVEELPLIHAFLDLFSAAVRPGSPAGIHLSATERAELLALPLPSQFTLAEWQAMIDRLDSFQGAALPSNVAEAEERMNAANALLIARGWKYRLDGLIQGHLRLSRARAPELGSEQFPARAHYYYLKNHDTGLVERGRLSASGTFEGIILTPDNYFTVAYYDPETRYAGMAFFQSRSTGETTEILTAPLEPLPPDLEDQDGDQLPDVVERLLGTNPGAADTDGDGIGEFQELFANTNPLDGIARSAGVIAVFDTPGNAVDVTAWDDLVAVADSAAGVALFDVVNPQAPVLLAQLETPGSAVAVAGVGERLAVADSAAGVALYDVSNPAAATLLMQKALGNSARAVALVDELIVVGLNTGELVLLDESGEIQQRFMPGLVGIAIEDVLWREGLLYVLQQTQLTTITLADRHLTVTNTVSSPGVAGAGGRRLRITSDARRLFATQTQGYNVFDLTNPLAPVPLRNIFTAQAGWKQIVSDGNGLALAAVNPNSTDDGPHDISLYDVGSEGTNSVFQATFATPGRAEAIALYQGLGFAADGPAGLSVIGYRTPDTLGQPPTIDLVSIFSPGPATQMSGQTFRLLADARDDVQVRNVEFFLDGVRVGNDSANPYELVVRAPILSATQTIFTVQARATDTGGNSKLTALQMVTLIPETVPPLLTFLLPTNGSRLAPIAVNPITATFDERLLPSSVSSANVRLSVIEGSVTSSVPITITLAPNQKRFTVEFTPFEDSDNDRRLQLTLTAGIRDVSGNSLIPIIAEYVLPQVNRLLTGASWNVAANWSSGLPTGSTPVQLGIEGVPRTVQLDPPLVGEAFTFVTYDNLKLLNGLVVVRDAVFYGKLSFIEQSSLTAGGEVRLHGGVEMTGSNGGVSVTAPLVRNFGTLLVEKDSSASPFVIGGTTVFRNEPGATFHLRAGVVLMTPDAHFDNQGSLTHAGAALGKLASANFQNFGNVQVAESRLELLGGSENFGVATVSNGATLMLGNAEVYGIPVTGTRHHFAASSRLDGSGTLVVWKSEVRFDGPVDFNGPIQFEESRGSLFFNGVTRLRGPLDLSGAFSFITQSGVGNDVTFGGLSAQIDQAILMGTNSTLTFNQSIPARVPGLDARQSSRIGGRGGLIVTGASVLNGAEFIGAGPVRFDGPSDLWNLTVNGPLTPNAPKVIEFNGPARFGNPNIAQDLHRFTQTLLRVQTNGVLDLGYGGAFRYGSQAVGSFLFENYGVVRHSTTNRTDLELRFGIQSSFGTTNGVSPLMNWGTLEMLAGELRVPALVQKAGLTEIRGGQLIAGESGAGATIEGGVFRLAGGKYSGPLTFKGGQLDFPNGAMLPGQLRIYGGTLDLAPPAINVSSILQTNGVLRLNGGALVATNGFEIRPGGVFTGHGTLQGGLSMRGEISPGSPFGVLSVTGGDYTHENGGRFVVDIGGTTPGIEFDQLKVGSLTISSGATLDIKLVNGFSPAIGAEFPILTAASGTRAPRAFATVVGLPIDAGKKFVVIYEPSGVKLRVVPGP